LAGKAGAIYLEKGVTIEKKYEALFKNEETVGFSHNNNTFKFGYYPNRNSLPYIDLYQLKGIQTFVRTTLRHPDFMDGWNNIIELHLTDETPSYQSDEKTLMNFFKDYFKQQNFNDWLDKKLSVPFAESAKILEEIEQMDSIQSKMEKTGLLSEKMEVANSILKQLHFLGMDDNKTYINKGFCSPADVLQFVLEKKLALQKNDKDMVVMLHEIEYKLNNELHKVTSSLVVKGEDALNTAMAKTVGLPLGIAAKLILNGEIKLTGLHIPIMKEIYSPVLKELKKQHIEFYEVHDGE
jgi:saccharopine dehydrogenase-like NADP-dependent oxidoreductase